MKLLKKIPAYGYIAGILFFALQYGLYQLGNYLSGVIGTKENAWCPKIFLDNYIPVVSVFVVIYVFSYVFWICGPMAVSIGKKSHFINYVVGLLLAYLIGFLIFTFAPTYMDRVAEGLTTYAGNGIFDKMLQTVYASDGGDIAFNLFPSYHCMISTYCYLGVRKQPEISKGFKIYSFIMALLICISTQLTRQHYLLDMVAGISIAVICYIIVGKWNPGKEPRN